MNRLKLLSQYIPFILIVLGMVSVASCGFMVATPLGFLIIGISLFLLAYILAPKGGQS